MEREELAQIVGNYFLDNIDKLSEQVALDKTKNIKRVTVDVKKLAGMLGVSSSSIYNPISSSEEFLKIEADYGGKRLWYADKVDKAWNDYLKKYGTRGIDRLSRSERHRILVEEA